MYVKVLITHTHIVVVVTYIIYADVMIERGHRLSDVRTAGERLETDSEMFHRRAVQFKQEAQREYCKAMWCYVLLIIAIALVVLMFIWDHFFREKEY